MSARLYWLTVDQMRMLDHWCATLRDSFTAPLSTPYLVGSACLRPDFRDVDIRIPLEDAVFDALPIDPLDLNMMLSTWGRQSTGLPIDCQVQKLSEFRATDGPRHPRGSMLRRRSEPPKADQR